MYIRRELGIQLKPVHVWYNDFATRVTSIIPKKNMIFHFYKFMYIKPEGFRKCN